MPPTERKGRIHTSTITVAVIEISNKSENSIYLKRTKNDYRVEWFSGTGKGGQHRNKHQNSCRLIHIPTNIVISIQGRERKSNLNKAYIELNLKLDREDHLLNEGVLNKDRKSQIGSGMRGDKIRTLRVQDDQVLNHDNSKRISFKKYMKGNIDDLWS